MDEYITIIVVEPIVQPREILDTGIALPRGFSDLQTPDALPDGGFQWPHFQELLPSDPALLTDGGGLNLNTRHLLGQGEPFNDSAFTNLLFEGVEALEREIQANREAVNAPIDLSVLLGTDALNQLVASDRLDGLDPALVNALLTGEIGYDALTDDFLFTVTDPQIAEGFALVADLRAEIATIPEGVDGISFQGIINAAVAFTNAYEQQLIELSLTGPPSDDRERERAEELYELLEEIGWENVAQMAASIIIPPVGAILDLIDIINSFKALIDDPSLYTLGGVGLAFIFGDLPGLDALSGIAKRLDNIPLIGRRLDEFIVNGKLDFDLLLARSLLFHTEQLTGNARTLFETADPSEIQNFLSQGYTPYSKIFERARQDLNLLVQQRNRLANFYLSLREEEILYRGQDFVFDANNPIRSYLLRSTVGESGYYERFARLEALASREQIASFTSMSNTLPIPIDRIKQIMGDDISINRLQTLQPLGSYGIPFTRRLITTPEFGPTTYVIRIPRDRVIEPSVPFSIPEQEVIVLHQVDFEHFFRSYESRTLPRLKIDESDESVFGIVGGSGEEV